MASATRQERSWATMIRDSLARIELDGPEAAAPLLPDRLLERHGTELVWLGLSRRMAPRRPGPESDFAVPSRSRALDRRLAELAGQAPVPAAAGPPPAAPRAPGMAAGRIARTPGLIAAGRRLPDGPPLSDVRGLAIAKPGRFHDAVREDADARAAGGPEATIGEDNKLPFNFLLKGARLGRAVCMVRAVGVNYEGIAGEWAGTGFLVAPGVLLTNHHVLNSLEVAQAARARFDFAVDADDRMMPAREFALDPARLFVTSPFQFPDGKRGLDYTVVGIDIDEAARRDYGFIPAERASFVVKAGDPANVVHHPRGVVKHVSLQKNVVAGLNEQLIHYTTDTEPGSSGCPVFSNGWCLIGLHHSAEPNLQRYNPLNDPLPPRLVNEGVRIAAIAVDLEQRVGAGDEHARRALAAFKGVDSALGFFGALGRAARGDATGVEAVTDAYRGEADDVDVGFWNIEWFTNRWESKLEDVARFIADLNLDVWALVESSPEAARRLVAHLREHWGLEFACAFSEPGSPDGKQSTTVLWNTRTVKGERLDWPPEIDRWFGVHSREFEDLRLEAVHGRIFDRYPGLFRFKAIQRDAVGGAPFDFLLVPLHLKAMAEGDLRRRMASRILAAAIRKMQAEHGADQDWVIGGDFNAELATGAFDGLRADGLLPLSAADEASGAFSYLKRPRSLIDHIFLSPNLARTYNGDDFFIIAAEGRDTSYLRDVSDHRPVLVRLSLRRQAPSEASALPDDLRQALADLDRPRELPPPSGRVLRAVAEAPAAWEPEPPKPSRPRRKKAA
ncbi:MAG TPA: trypsin-like peptidase domain-containing protein [Geminicoccaceae bacterium]|nr:trypsin-like peptidase domain-containing protein [Geminicoccaceae bacterium]